MQNIFSKHKRKHPQDGSGLDERDAKHTKHNVSPISASFQQLTRFPESSFIRVQLIEIG